MSFTVYSVIRGYHEYKDMWIAVIGEELSCKREPTNKEDRFAVAVTKDSSIVGHIPRKISAICSLFLWQSGKISCCVTGPRQYSSDLPQGGLEIPCTLKFTRAKDLDHLEKVKKLIEHALSFVIDEFSYHGEFLDRVKREVTDDSCEEASEEALIGDGGDSNNDGNDLVINDESVCSASNNVVDLTMGSDAPSVFPRDENDADWCRFGGIRLTQQNKYDILRGDKLNDLVINFVQKLLKKQFPFVKGLQSTLLQSKPLKPSDNSFASRLQVIHCRNDHWMIASTMHSGPTAKVQIYDSLFDTIDSQTKTVISNLFGSAANPEIIVVPRQAGIKDCGVFALANLIALCFRMNPADTHFKQDLMRLHLVQCMESGTCTPFPLTKELPHY